VEKTQHPGLSSSGPIIPSERFDILTGVVPALLFVGGIVVFFKLLKR
jgi:hypothetical protein